MMKTCGNMHVSDRMCSVNFANKDCGYNDNSRITTEFPWQSFSVVVTFVLVSLSVPLSFIIIYELGL